MLLNRYPLWKNVLVLFVVILAFIYAAPNLYGDDPAIQIMGENANISIGPETQNKIQHILQSANIAYKKIQVTGQTLLIRFYTNEVQLKARDILQDELGSQYLVALNLAPKTPSWLKAIGAYPMKLGLDLRGGIHLLMQVDVNSVLKQRVESDLTNVSQTLRTERIRYSGIQRVGANGIVLQFRTEDAKNDAASVLAKRFPEFIWEKSALTLKGTLSTSALAQTQKDVMEQSMNILRQRVNELGVTEATVQLQGTSRISVDLPGIVDTAQAKNILGKTATLEFHMVDTENDARLSVGGIAPPDDKLYYSSHGEPLLLKNLIILKGASIISARSSLGEDGRPAVDVRLAGSGDALFTQTTTENVGKPMAVLFVDIKSETRNENGKKVIQYHTDKRIISVATIRQGLGNIFQITGLSNTEEARTLALLLRAGALPAAITPIEEREIGANLGKQNINKGLLSVAVGFILVVLFMGIYYRTFGWIANLALGMNLVLIIAILSLLGGTLTLPGIAGIVLIVGMAADANVLIFERIREELRNGAGAQASIHGGYERALITIVDSNLTTLIVAVVLFGLGSGVVKNFAITVTIGLITSMFTAITGTRALVNLLYGGRTIKKLPIGI